MRAILPALLLLACAGYPWNVGPAQMPLGGDRECSNAPDIAEACCWGHDNCYWSGGTEQDRLTCDAEFHACMLRHGVPKWLARVYYDAVDRWGGGSFTYLEHRTRGP